MIVLVALDENVAYTFFASGGRPALSDFRFGTPILDSIPVGKKGVRLAV